MKALLFFFLPFVLFSCKKWENQGACEVYTEIKDNGHTVDPHSYNLPELNDTLAKYPQLRLFRVNQDQYGWHARCYVVHNHVAITHSAYYLHKRFNDGALYITGELPDVGNISLTPSISGTEAVRIAWQNANFGMACIDYQLQIYDTDTDFQDAVKNYRLVWQVEGDRGAPTVILDALNGEVYVVDNGIRT